MSRRLFEYHPVIGYRFIPGLEARVAHEGGGYLIRVNSAGFRCDREFVATRTPGRRRVLLFGDSFTAGDGVSNSKRWGDLLEHLVPDLEVYNLALPGTGTDQQYLTYREFADGIEHDGLIIAVQVENIRRIVARYRVYQDEAGRLAAFAKPYFQLAGDALTLCQVPPPREPVPLERLPDDHRPFVDQGGRLPGVRRALNRTGLKTLAQRVTRFQPVPEYASAEDPAWRLLRAILVRWIGGHRMPALVVPLPLYHFVEGTSDPRPYQQRFGELAGDIGCRLHDPLPDLVAYPPAERRRFRFDQDIHPTPAGHAALARSVAPALQALIDSVPVDTNAPGRRGME